MPTVKCIMLYMYIIVCNPIIGYVPLPKIKLDFTELEAKSSKKVCYVY